MKQNKPKLKKKLRAFVKDAPDWLDDFRGISNEFVCGDYRYKLTIRRYGK